MIPSAWQNLSPNERDVLLVLAVEEPMIGTDINHALGRPDAQRSGLSMAITRLEEKGYITRDPAEDRPGNSQRNALTPEGRALVAEVAEAIHE